MTPHLVKLYHAVFFVLTAHEMLVSDVTQEVAHEASLSTYPEDSWQKITGDHMPRV